MPQPTPYALSFSFTDFAAAHPSLPLPGASVDAQFNALVVSLTGVLANLAKLQRDDGALKNQIVTLDSLSPTTLLTLGAGSTWTPKGAWVTAYGYVASDVVTNGTGSYVCAVTHFAAALFATDLAAGRWVQLYNSAGITPGDETVTAAKLADGSVTTVKIGFSSLDLAGNIRAATGLQAGTAPGGSLMHAKLAAGAVQVKAERVTDAQGIVGYQVIGETVTWDWVQPTGASTLTVRRNGTTVTTFTALGGIDQAGGIRAVAGVTPTTGIGATLLYDGTIGSLVAYDYTNTAWLDLALKGKNVTLWASGVNVLSATSAGVALTGASCTLNGNSLGYLGLPTNTQSAAYTFVLADFGKKVLSKNVAGQTIILPLQAAVAWPADTVLIIVNDGTNPITLSTTGAYVRLAGSAPTGDRTIAVGSIASLIRIGTDRWFISGPGVS